MTAHDIILADIRRNRPSARTLPAVPRFHSDASIDLKEKFCISLKQMAGEAITERPVDLGQFIAARFPAAKKICSVVPELKGNCAPADFATEADTAAIDVSVLRAPLGVAETGSVLLSESELVMNTVGLLAHDIVVLLDPNDIVENIHDAYRHPYFRESGYCLLMSGPSGSGDISGVIVHPAQSSMTVTVIFARRTSYRLMHTLFSRLSTHRSPGCAALSGCGGRRASRRNSGRTQDRSNRDRPNHLNR